MCDPSFTNSMMVPARAKPLTRFHTLNFSGRMSAYAHATGIAVRRPGRTRLASTISVRVHARADGVAVRRQLREAVESEDAAAQQPAAGADHPRPPIGPNWTGELWRK